MKTLFASALILAMFAVSPASALTESTCADVWTKADVNKDGNIDETEAAANKDELTKMGWEDTSPVSQANYMTGCKAT